MEYLEGQTLDAYVDSQEGRLPYEVVAAMTGMVLEALKAVHGETLPDGSAMVHRDIKPQNLYITDTGQVKLLDFGAARFAGGQSDRSATAIGTEGYAALAGPQEEAIAPQVAAEIATEPVAEAAIPEQVEAMVAESEPKVVAEPELAMPVEEKTPPPAKRQSPGWIKGVVGVAVIAVLFVAYLQWDQEDPTAPASDPSGPSSGSFRVIRGGSWYSLDAACRSANRIRFSPDSRDFDLGFRLVRTAN